MLKRPRVMDVGRLRFVIYTFYLLHTVTLLRTYDPQILWSTNNNKFCTLLTIGEVNQRYFFTHIPELLYSCTYFILYNIFSSIYIVENNKTFFVYYILNGTEFFIQSKFSFSMI